MKNNYIGSLLIAFAIGTLIFFAGAHACESYPFLAKWVGGECWFDNSSENTAGVSSTVPELRAEQGFLKATALMGGETDDDVLKAAIFALAQSGSEEAVATLQEIVRTHANLEIRKAALYALAQCAEARQLVAFYSDIVEHNDMLALRKAALYSLAEIDDDAVVGVMEAVAMSMHHVELRKAAVYALQNCGSEPAQQALYRILTNVSDGI